ncbi:efflux RND transporter periplasmic adaptor subunit [candidate division WOR-3 bacterium]|nr:efflux RND transporter periplasmic adaptor subunit [candidate division WOR-3 bacterium]
MTTTTRSCRLKMLLLTATAAALLPVSCRSRQETAGSGQPAARVRVTTAARQTLEATIELPGSIRPEVSTAVPAPVEGRITNMLAREGERVNSGQVLATISPLVHNDIINAARLALEERRRDGGETLTARQQLDFALGAYREAPVVSTVEGVVARRLADPGDVVTVRQGLYEIHSADRFHVEVPVSELHLFTCLVGTAVQVRLDAMPGRPLEGTIQRIHPLVAEQTRTATVEIALPSPPPGIQAGMFARVTLPLNRSVDAITIPEKALLTAPDGSAFIFVHADSTVNRRSVEVGIESANGVEILSGLADGEKVVVDGQEALKDGQRVTVMEDRKNLPPTAKP